MYLWSHAADAYSRVGLTKEQYVVSRTLLSQSVKYDVRILEFLMLQQMLFLCFFSVQILTECYTNVLAIVNNVKLVSNVDGIVFSRCCFGWYLARGLYIQQDGSSSLPSMFPLTQGIDILLQTSSIRMFPYMPVRKAVVGKKAEIDPTVV